MDLEAGRDVQPTQGPSTVIQPISGFFPFAHDFTILGGIFNNINVNGMSALSGMEKLKQIISLDSMYDSSARDPPPICHPGTRERILDMIIDWINDQNNSQPILWLCGAAGIGKSAIAQSIAKRCSETEQIGASFFFSRNSADGRTTQKLFPTLVYTLTLNLNLPGLRGYIESLFERVPDIAAKNLEVQCDYLIKRVIDILHESPGPHPKNFVVIIDGVDECTDPHIPLVLKLIGDALIDGAVRADNIKNVPLRFLICSRPEARINWAFRATPLNLLTRSVILDNVPEALDDVRRFLSDEFSRIGNERAISTPWPADGVINLLVDRSSGQFIYASTAIKFIDDQYHDPTEQLPIVLGLNPSHSSTPFVELDDLYKRILSSLRPQARPLIRRILVLMVALGQPEIRYISEELRVNQNELRATLGAMSSLLHVTSFVGTYHASFFDFLQDASRSGEHFILPSSIYQIRFPLIVKARLAIISAKLHLTKRGAAGVVLGVPILVVDFVASWLRGLPLPAWSDMEILRSFVSFNAAYGIYTNPSLPLCHPGTRTRVLKIITGWVADPNAQHHLMLLSGDAGTGKSTIARTVTNSCKRAGRLAATFFMNDKNMWAVDSFVPTLASQFADSIPEAGECIKAALKADPLLPTRSIKEQFDRLIMKVFEHLKGRAIDKIFVIIDGIDHRADARMQGLMRLIGGMAKAQIPLRFLICVRRDSPIIATFEEFNNVTRHLILDNLLAPPEDVQKYLGDELRRIFRPRNPDISESLEHLVSMSPARGFIFASLIVKFIEQSARPEQHLSQLARVGRDQEPSLDYNLDRLYLQILSSVSDQKILMVVLVLVVEYKFFSHTRAIKHSRGKSESVYRCFHELGPLLHVSDSWIEPHDPSFRQFLLDPRRAGKYYVSAKARASIRRTSYLFVSLFFVISGIVGPLVFKQMTNKPIQFPLPTAPIIGPAPTFTSAATPVITPHATTPVTTAHVTTSPDIVTSGSDFVVPFTVHSLTPLFVPPTLTLKPFSMPAVTK